MASELDSIGMGIDFKTIKQVTREVTDELDHQYLNDLPPFETMNPTAENIAVYIYDQVSKRLDSPQIKVKAITLWETERACVRFEP